MNAPRPISPEQMRERSRDASFWHLAQSAHLQAEAQRLADEASRHITEYLRHRRDAEPPEGGDAA